MYIPAGRSSLIPYALPKRSYIYDDLFIKLGTPSSSRLRDCLTSKTIVPGEIPVVKVDSKL